MLSLLDNIRPLWGFVERADELTRQLIIAASLSSLASK